ncbi:MAG: glycosyltransferase [bacterium]
MAAAKPQSLIGQNLSCLDRFYPAEAHRVRRVLDELRRGSRPLRFRLNPEGTQYLCRCLDTAPPVWIHGPHPPFRTVSHILGSLAPDSPNHIVIWRAGLGYLPAAVFQKTPVRLTILEPDEELFALSLDVTDWIEILSSPRCLLMIGSQAKRRFHSLLLRSCPETVASPCVVIPGIERTDGLSAELDEIDRDIRLAQSSLEAVDKSPSLSIDFLLHGAPTTEIFFPALLEAMAELDYRGLTRSSGDARFRFLCSSSNWTSFLESGRPSLLVGMNRGALPPPVEKVISERQIPQILYFLEDADWYDPSIEDWGVFERVYVFDPNHGSRLDSLGYPGRRVLPAAASLRRTKVLPAWMNAQRLPVTFVGSSGLKRGADRYFDQMDRVCPGLRSDFERLTEGCLQFGASWVRNQLPKEERLAGLGSQGLHLKMIEEAATILRRLGFLESLYDQPLTVFGDTGWTDAGQVGPLAERYGGRSTAYPAETEALYSCSDININLFHLQCEHSIIARVYDVMACGGFLLSEHSPALEETFKIGEELDTFRTPEELHEKVVYYLHHPAEREEIARCGQATVLRHHTYKNRLLTILADLGLRDL